MSVVNQHRPGPGRGLPLSLTVVTAAVLVVVGALPVSAQAPAPAGGKGGSVADAGRGATLTARYRVRQMEHVLERAVQHAADMMRRRLQAVTPDLLALAGMPRAQGFRLDGYGLFFSVEVPRLSESVNWALRVLSQDRDERVLASLHKVAASEQDPAVRADLERAIRTVELQLSAVTRPAGVVAPRKPVAPPPSTARTETAMAADRPGLPAPPQAPGSAASELVASMSSVPVEAQASEVAPAAMMDPSAAYEDEVKEALMDAMLDYAGALPLSSAEWITVAARDAGYMAFPDSLPDMVTVTLSVRVADLVEFRAQRLTRDQARTRVVVREF